MPIAREEQPANTVLIGIGIAPGLAVGTAYLYRDIFDTEQVVLSISPHEVDDEYARIRQAVREVHEDLTLCADKSSMT